MNPYTSPKSSIFKTGDSHADTDSKKSRNSILKMYVLIGLSVTITTMFVSTIVHQFLITPGEFCYSFPRDFGIMHVLLPVGMILGLISPLGWVSVVGLILALKKYEIKYLLLCLPACLAVGIWWPPMFIAMMGV